MKRGTYVKRSVYQKVVEEKKRLKVDMKILIMAKHFDDRNKIFIKYRKIFTEEYKTDKIIKDAVLAYIKNNPNDKAVKFVKSLKPIINTKN